MASGDTGHQCDSWDCDRYGSRNEQRPDSADETRFETNLGRRQYLLAAGTAATVGLAGCNKVSSQAFEATPVRLPEANRSELQLADTGGCNSFTRQSLLSAETDPFRLDSQFECSRTYSHQYETAFDSDTVTREPGVGGAEDEITTTRGRHDCRGGA